MENDKYLSAASLELQHSSISPLSSSSKVDSLNKNHLPDPSNIGSQTTAIDFIASNTFTNHGQPAEIPPTLTEPSTGLTCTPNSLDNFELYNTTTHDHPLICTSETCQSPLSLDEHGTCIHFNCTIPSANDQIDIPSNSSTWPSTNIPLIATTLDLNINVLPPITDEEWISPASPDFLAASSPYSSLSSSSTPPFQLDIEKYCGSPIVERFFQNYLLSVKVPVNSKNEEEGEEGGRGGGGEGNSRCGLLKSEEKGDLLEILGMNYEDVINETGVEMGMGLGFNGYYGMPELAVSIMGGGVDFDGSEREVEK